MGPDDTTVARKCPITEIKCCEQHDPHFLSVKGEPSIRNLPDMGVRVAGASSIENMAWDYHGCNIAWVNKGLGGFINSISEHRPKLHIKLLFHTDQNRVFLSQVVNCDLSKEVSAVCVSSSRSSTRSDRTLVVCHCLSSNCPGGPNARRDADSKKRVGP